MWENRVRTRISRRVLLAYHSDRRQSTAASDMASNPPEPGRAMRSPTSEHIPPSVVALGPATKRALENLQHEIVALNNRIDGLKEE